MASNSIPNELRSDHLFLLVGTNPLPDYVAAKLLLRDGGSLYLVHSGTTQRVAERLFAFAKKEGQEDPIYVQIRDEHDAESVKQAIRSQLGLIKSGSIGLNYTGGTKVMAVHSYDEMKGLGRDKVVFSYLEASEFLLRIEAFKDYKQGFKQSVGLEVPLKLKELFSLHEQYNLKESIEESVCGATITSSVVLHKRC